MKGGISIHALRGEGDPYSPSFINKHDNFNPRPPWGGRQNVIRINFYTRIISIHALRGEGDLKYTVFLGQSFLFQSTPSVGRATKCTVDMIPMQKYFNPRPPWGGRLSSFSFCFAYSYFNPRPPWGGRPINTVSTTRPSIFQSTPSVGRATRALTKFKLKIINFNPRPPWGGRL